MCGSVRLKPKFTPEVSSIKLFGPGVAQDAKQNKKMGSKKSSVMPTFLKSHTPRGLQNDRLNLKPNAKALVHAGLNSLSQRHDLAACGGHACLAAFVDEH